MIRIRFREKKEVERQPLKKAGPGDLDAIPRNGQRACEVNARKASGRQAGGDQVAIKLGGNESGPEDLGFALVRCGLHIQRQKGVKNVVGEKGHQ